MLWVRGDAGLETGEFWRRVQRTAGMQYVRGPMFLLSVASDGKEEGGVEVAACSYENCSVLKQSDCKTA